VGHEWEDGETDDAREEMNRRAKGRALVTGGAGFVGSHLAQQAAENGYDVIAVDSLTPYYDTRLKKESAEALLDSGIEFVDADLRELSLPELLSKVDVIFHQAGQPGVRSSWANGFDDYIDANIKLTQQLLEACREVDLRRFVYASSSSVYGHAQTYPVKEDDPTRPFSPYGVTKLAAEHLCSLYAANWGLPTVSLRYFSVYGPRQRPDMAFHRLIDAVLRSEPFPLMGDGNQVRDFTYVDDVVEANLLAAERDLEPGLVFNIAGGSTTTLWEVIQMVEDVTGGEVPLQRLPAQPGDVRKTSGSIERALAQLGWSPDTDLRTGIERQFSWQRDRC
jgi:UDP-glucuronate 4-epimerase